MREDSGREAAVRPMRTDSTAAQFERMAAFRFVPYEWIRLIIAAQFIERCDRSLPITTSVLLKRLVRPFSVCFIVFE